MLINNNNTVSNKRANKKFNIDKPVFGERNKIKFVKEIIKKTSTKKKYIYKIYRDPSWHQIDLIQNQNQMLMGFFLP